MIGSRLASRFASRFAFRFNVLSFSFAALVFCGCTVKSVREDDGQKSTEIAAPDVSNPMGEVSLKADRSAMDEARKGIPEEIKKENDEVAGILSFIVRESDEEPNKLRDRFNTALRKKRERADREFRKKREEFTKKERSEREDFLKKQKEERDDFIGRKRSTDERKRFFEKQDERRKEFFADSSDRRKEFESSVQEQRKELEDYVREKTGAFNQEWRQYQTRYTERKRALDLKKKMEEKSRKQSQSQQQQNSPQAEASFETPNSATSTVPSKPASLDAKAALDEFDQIPAGPGVPLQPQKGN